MATYSQTPGLLNIKGVVGAHFSCQLDFSASLVGYIFDSAIVLQDYPALQEQEITVTVDDAAEGIITLSLTSTQTSAVGAISGKKWYLNWTIGGLKRTILAGVFQLSNIPLGQNIVTSTGVTINTQDVDITLSAFSNAALDGKQPLDADLTAIAGLSPSNNDFIQRKSGAWTNRTIAQVKNDLAINNVNNTSDLDKPLSNAAVSALSYKVNTNQISTFGYSLVDDTTAAAARTTLGLGTISTQNANNVNVTGGTVSGITDLALADGGTGGSLSAVSGGVVYSGASAFAITPAGISGQLLQSNGAGAPSWISLPDIEVGTAVRATINNNTSSNRDFFPVFAYQSANTGSLLYGDSAKLKYNPSNGYLYSSGINLGGDMVLDGGGLGFAGNVIFSPEELTIFNFSSGVVAVWGEDGMYVDGIASQNVPLRLFDSALTADEDGTYVIVTPSNSSTTNGTNLRTAYANAKALTPGNSALSATNRATVLLLPGKYDLGTTPLAMDTEFVDLVGISSDPKHVLITSQINTSDTGTVVQTVDNVIIRNVTIDLTGTPAGSGAGRTAAYFPGRDSTSISSWTSDGATATIASNSHGLQTGDSVRITGSGNNDLNGAHTVTRIDNNSFTFPSTVNDSGSIGTATERFDDTYIENCVFSGTSDSGMRQSVEYAGTYRRCTGGVNSFSGIASGVFKDCSVGGNSFANKLEASGTFEDCVAGNSSFGGGTSTPSVASGTFKRCIAGDFSFGFYDCTGVFEDCVAGSNSFGSANVSGIFSATLKNCELTASAVSSFTGTMRGCSIRATGVNQSALQVGTGAKIFDSTLIATGTGESITASSAATIQLAGCRMNKSINSNVSNSLGTLTESFNLIDSDID